MCLAIPMRIIELTGGDVAEKRLSGATAIVDAGGIRKEVHLDLLGFKPAVGDYLIVHAGFAIQVLSKDAALENLILFRQMARGVGG